MNARIDYEGFGYLSSGDTGRLPESFLVINAAEVDVADGIVYVTRWKTGEQGDELAFEVPLERLINIKWEG
jgi:hypothetical protein